MPKYVRRMIGVLMKYINLFVFLYSLYTSLLRLKDTSKFNICRSDYVSILNSNVLNVSLICFLIFLHSSTLLNSYGCYDY